MKHAAVGGSLSWPSLCTQVALGILFLAGAAPGLEFHTSPACWDEPRIFHGGPPSADLANRLHRIETPAEVVPRGPSVPSPDGVRRFWVRNPDTTKPGPWGAAIVIDSGQVLRPTILVDDVGGPLRPRWISERLIFVRVPWGRVVFTDLILDATTGVLRYHEVAHDGADAYAQYQAACRGQCPCPDSVTEASAEADRFSVDAPVPPATPGPDAHIGLLELPTIFGPPEQGGIVPAEEPQAVPVYGEADASLAPLAELVDLAHFERREFTYEGAAAVVYRRIPGWYEIGVKMKGRNRAWVRSTADRVFMPIGDLLMGRMAYLNEWWDGHLWSEPGGGLRTESPSRLRTSRDDGRSEISVTVSESREVNGGLWLHVETHEGTGCGGGGGDPIDQGWIPAYAVNGNLVAGYYSRGC